MSEKDEAQKRQEAQKLQKKLAYEQTISALNKPGIPLDSEGHPIAEREGTKVIAGPGDPKSRELRASSDLAQEHGGKAKDWQQIRPVNLDEGRKSTGNPKEPVKSPRVELHSFHNPKIGKTVGIHVPTDQIQRQTNASGKQAATPKATAQGQTQLNKASQKATPKTPIAEKGLAQSKAATPRAVPRSQNQALESEKSATPKAQSTNAGPRPSAEPKSGDSSQQSTPNKGTASTPSSSSSSSGSSQSNTSGQNRSR